MRRSFFTLVIAGLCFIGPTLAEGLDAERVRGLVERGEILPLTEILKRNEAGLAGRIIEIEIEQKQGSYLYEIKVLRADGRYRELKIDARTGTVVKEE